MPSDNNEPTSEPSIAKDPPSDEVGEVVRGRYIYDGTCMQILGTPEHLRVFHSIYQHDLFPSWRESCPVEIARADAQIEKGFLAIRSLDAASRVAGITEDAYSAAVHAAITFNPNFKWVDTEEGHSEMFATMYARAPRRGPAVACPILGRTTPEPAPVAVETQGEWSGAAVVDAVAAE